jgi:hypothetical protein
LGGRQHTETEAPGPDVAATAASVPSEGACDSRFFVPLNDIANSPARIEQRPKKVSDGAGGLVEQTVKFPIWFDALANGGTPMVQALTKAHTILSGWTAGHPNSFPPIAINITDGDSTDGDPTPAAEGVRNLGTSDGNVILFNIHISSQKGTPIQFPDVDAGLPDDHARRLFNMSSLLPPHLQAAAKQEGFRTSEMTRGFAFNADLVSLIKFLDIGTRPSNLR